MRLLHSGEAAFSNRPSRVPPLPHGRGSECLALTIPGLSALVTTGDLPKKSPPPRPLPSCPLRSGESRAQIRWQVLPPYRPPGESSFRAVRRKTFEVVYERVETRTSRTAFLTVRSKKGVFARGQRSCCTPEARGPPLAAMLSDVNEMSSEGGVVWSPTFNR
jgi:hypothetical protein